MFLPGRFFTGFEEPDGFCTGTRSDSVKLLNEGSRKPEGIFTAVLRRPQRQVLLGKNLQRHNKGLRICRIPFNRSPGQAMVINREIVKERTIDINRRIW